MRALPVPPLRATLPGRVDESGRACMLGSEVRGNQPYDVDVAGL